MCGTWEGTQLLLGRAPGVLLLEDTARLKIEQGDEGTLKEAETVERSLLIRLILENCVEVWGRGEDQKIGSD